MEEAVYSDCYCLIDNFVQNGNPSFATFCTEWKNIGFQHIFSAQTTYIELQQTVGAAFHIGKRVMCNRHVWGDNAYKLEISDDIPETKQILNRIGGLYLLYAIYFKQALCQYTKIEVSLETWQEMQKFIKEILPGDDHNYDEARYVFWKLYQSQAFRFTALDFCLGLENLVDYDDLESSVTQSISVEPTDIGKVIDKITNFNEINAITPALVALEEGYNEMKQTLTQLHGLDRQMLPPIKIFESIRDSFQNIKSILNETQTEETSENPRTSSLRRRLKDKAYNGLNSEEKQNSTGGSRKVNSKKSRKFRRMSARTIFAEKLPKESNREEESSEADSDSEINEETCKTERRDS